MPTEDAFLDGVNSNIRSDIAWYWTCEKRSREERAFFRELQIGRGHKLLSTYAQWLCRWGKCSPPFFPFHSGTTCRREIAALIRAQYILVKLQNCTVWVVVYQSSFRRRFETSFSANFRRVLVIFDLVVCLYVNNGWYRVTAGKAWGQEEYYLLWTL